MPNARKCLGKHLTKRGRRKAAADKIAATAAIGTVGQYCVVNEQGSADSSKQQISTGNVSVEIQCNISGKLFSDTHTQTERPPRAVVDHAVSPIKAVMHSVASQSTFKDRQYMPAVLSDVVNIVKCYEDLAYTIVSDVSCCPTSIEITRNVWLNMPAVGYSLAKIVIFGNGNAHFVPMFASATTVQIIDDQKEVDAEAIHKILRRISSAGRAVWCKGIQINSLRVSNDLIVLSSYPCKDVRSRNCPGIFVAGKGVPTHSLNSGIWVCTSCAICAYSRKRKSADAMKSPVKRRRVDPSSNCTRKVL